MADTVNKGATDWQLNKLTLTHHNDKKFEINGGLINFNYYESLDSLNPTATITFSDLKTELNVKNGQTIEIELITTAHSDDDVWTHTFEIDKVKTESKDGAKLHTCNLVVPQSAKISKFKSKESHRGTPLKILKELFSNDKVAGDYAPLDIVTDGNEPFNNLVLQAGTKKKLTALVHEVLAQSIPASGKAMNTCGYFLWGTKKNLIGNKDTYSLHFKSIDSLLAVGGDHKGSDAEYEYYETDNATMVDVPAQLVISNFSVRKRGDCKKMVDDGVFKANVVLYNIDKKTYHKRTWDIRDHWDSWGHIARLPGNDPWDDSNLVQEVLNFEKVTKTFLLEISHEKFHDEEDPAEPGQIGDGENSQTAQFQDWDEETIVQYHARYATMFMAQSNLTIPGNQYLSAGDKVKLYLRDSRTDSKVEADTYDKELSGHYLVFKIRHFFSMVPKQECYTALTLVRDTLNKNC